MSRFTFCEFFAGGGMARAGLGELWRCLFANDFDQMKVETYEASWGAGDIRHKDVASLALSDLPPRAVDLVWASFPCQDLSLAGSYHGLGRERDKVSTRSGTFWPFWKLIRGLAQDGRAPRAIVLESVYGCLTSRGGKDFASTASALAELDYRFGAAVIEAAHFVPQSRPRVFFMAFRQDQRIPTSLVAEGPQKTWHPVVLIEAYAGIAATAKRNWIWWSISRPLARNSTFANLIEDAPTAVKWHAVAHTNYILSLMSPLNRKKVSDAVRSGHRVVGTVYRRTRPDENRIKRQRAEVRFDDVGGCLRSPAGGSSRQVILVVEGKTVRSRLPSPREAARLMRLDDDYVLPERYNHAYHVCGDGVCVPVVRHIAEHVLEPVLLDRETSELIAAE
jgi:DNA (cytosine-5)-methyltransferase 1